jgi:hypothetical protein
MGGNVLLGYDARERSLAMNPVEAETVRRIFASYRELGCVRQVKDEADRLGLRNEAQHDGERHRARRQTVLARAPLRTAVEPDLRRSHCAQGSALPRPAPIGHGRIAGHGAGDQERCKRRKGEAQSPRPKSTFHQTCDSYQGLIALTHYRRRRGGGGRLGNYSVSSEPRISKVVFCSLVAEPVGRED